MTDSCQNLEDCKGTAGEKCHGSTYGNSFHPPPALALRQKHTNFLPWNVRVWNWNISESISLFRSRQYLIRNTPATKLHQQGTVTAWAAQRFTKPSLQRSIKTICDWRRSFGDKVIRRYLGIFWTPSVAVESAKTNVYQIKKSMTKLWFKKKTKETWTLRLQVCTMYGWS